MPRLQSSRRPRGRGRPVIHELCARYNQRPPPDDRQLARSRFRRDEHQQGRPAPQDCSSAGRCRSRPEPGPPRRRGGDSARRSVGRSSSERRGDMVLAQPQRRGAQQAAIAAPSRPRSAEEQSVLPTPRRCSRPKAGVRDCAAARLSPRGCSELASAKATTRSRTPPRTCGSYCARAPVSSAAAPIPETAHASVEAEATAIGERKFHVFELTSSQSRRAVPAPHERSN